MPVDPHADPLLGELSHRPLPTAAVGDALDVMGRHQQFLPPQIRALDVGSVLVGRAMPVLIADVFGHQSRPFGRLTEALDSLQPGEIYLARNGRNDCAAWGEIMTTTARLRGATGAVIDGFHRDTRGVLAQHWPVFSRGAYAQDAGVRTAVVDFRVVTRIGGVTIHPGDLILGDVDGVVVVPRSIEREVIERATEKLQAERTTRSAIEAGMTSSDAYETFGVL